MSAFALEDGTVYHTYSTYARGLDGLWGMYQWLDRAPKGRNEEWRLVAPPRRVQGLSEVMLVAAQIRDPETRAARGSPDCLARVGDGSHHCRTSGASRRARRASPRRSGRRCKVAC